VLAQTNLMSQGKDWKQRSMTKTYTFSYGDLGTSCVKLLCKTSISFMCIMHLLLCFGIT